jgi:hypothetical protein
LTNFAWNNYLIIVEVADLSRMIILMAVAENEPADVENEE